MVDTVRVNSVLYTKVTQELLDGRVIYCGWFHNGNSCRILKLKRPKDYIGSIFIKNRSVQLSTDEAWERYYALKDLYRSYAHSIPKG